MNTFVTALFYLWMVITVLMVVMWLLRRQARPAPDDFDVVTDLPDGDPATDAEVEPVMTSSPSIGELLDGIALPYDLAPTVGRIADPDRHAVFLSPHTEPADIGMAFADELVKIGFAIEPAGLDEALAVRDTDVISLRLTPDAGSVAAGGRPRFPTATTTDVALEVWTGQGPPPRLMD